MGLRPAKGNTVILAANKITLTFGVGVAVSFGLSLLESTRLFLSAAVPRHPGGSTLARYLRSATIHHPCWIVGPTVVVSTSECSLTVCVHLTITFSRRAWIVRAAAVPVRPGFPGVSQNAGFLLAAVGFSSWVVFTVVNPTMEVTSTLVMFIAVALSKGTRGLRQAALVTVANRNWSRADDSRRPDGCQNSQKQHHPHI